jgi:hypothetical protein
VWFGPDEVWNCTSSDPTLSIEWTNFGDTSDCFFAYTYTGAMGPQRAVKTKAARSVVEVTGRQAHRVRDD